MADFLFAKHFTSLRPTDESGQEFLRGLGTGEIVKVTVTRPRNVRFHRLFFALLNLVYENTETFASVEQVLTTVKYGIGHFDTVIVNGQEEKHPRSISFARMDQDQFRQFWDRAVDYVIANILPANRADLEREVFEMIGIDLNMRDVA